MSYHAFTIDGYGICVDDIGYVSTAALRDFIKKDPELYANVMSWLSDDTSETKLILGDESFDDEAADLIMDEWESDDGLCTGLTPIMRSVILALENIDLVEAVDFDGVQYLLFAPFYPWSYTTKEEKSATQEGIQSMFEKYVGMLTDRPVKVQYYSVENGG